VRSAEQLGVDEVAGGGNEGQQGSCEHSGKREGERDPQERHDAARVEVLRRLDEPVVDLFQAHVDRQGHKREEVVRDARDDRGRRREQTAVLCEEVEALQGLHDETLVTEQRLPRKRAD
jgi:hypothetical protein